MVVKTADTAELAVITPRAIRVVVDLIVDEDRWDEAVQEGATEKFLVGEVRQTLHIGGHGLWRDYDLQEVKILEVTDGS